MSETRLDPRVFTLREKLALAGVVVLCLLFSGLMFLLHARLLTWIAGAMGWL